VVPTRDLRPLERRVLALRAAGVGDAEIARRFHRTPGYVKRVATLAGVDRRHDRRRDGRLTPLERRVLKWRDQGARPQDVAWRFRRSPEHIARVERLARYKLARAAS
jgi:DNA-binding CsgD family transcriptional regulator